MSHSVEFFEAQFRKQLAAGELALNPFETLALPFVRGRVLDLGCGLGNLSVAAARAGAEVTAVDASATAIERLRVAAREEHLRIEAVLAEAASYRIAGEYDAIVSIGLLMFMPCETARGLLAAMQAHVAPGGLAIVNVLAEGTTYMEMFDPQGYCLFARHELARSFAAWTIELDRHDSFDAPAGTQKVFSTIVARRP